MGLTSLLRSLYDLDTLDTRFTSSSSAPYKTVIEARNDPSRSKEPPNRAQARAEPSKWNTPEFYLYYLVVGIALPYMFYIAYDVSRGMLEGRRKVESWLTWRTQSRIRGTRNMNASSPTAGSRVARSYVCPA
jgi:hypothetical protein